MALGPPPLTSRLPMSLRSLRTAEASLQGSIHHHHHPYWYVYGPDFSYGWSGPLPQFSFGRTGIMPRDPSVMVGLSGEVLTRGDPLLPPFTS